MSIRKATINDAFKVLKMWEEIHEFHITNTRNIFKDFPKEEMYKRYLDLVEDDSCYIYVYDDDGVIKGFILAQIVETKDSFVKLDKKEVLIDTLGVSEKYRNLDIGKSLINAVENEAKRINADQLILSVYDFNTAKSFYKKCGFEYLTIKMKKEI